MFDGLVVHIVLLMLVVIASVIIIALYLGASIQKISRWLVLYIVPAACAVCYFFIFLS